ncbi:hypothetical protein AB0758_46900 [Tolypothrix bouteillei VB521301_2]|uniref:hypothetical protein n=1 Tax=Tolypothrix bouteillei TaxID=1246981 RepID=UPI0038B54A26
MRHLEKSADIRARGNLHSGRSLPFASSDPNQLVDTKMAFATPVPAECDRTASPIFARIFFQSRQLKTT